MNMRNVLGVVLSIALAFGFVPAQGLIAAQAATGDADQAAGSKNTTWRDDIDDMLSASNYAEGEALVTVPIDASGASALDEFDPSLTYERIFETTGDAFEESSGEAVSEDVLAEFREGDETVSADDVTLGSFLVSSPTLSTRQLLEALASEPKVLDASPNYLYSSFDGDAFDQNESSDDQGDEAVYDGEASGEREDEASVAGEYENNEDAAVSEDDANSTASASQPAGAADGPSDDSAVATQASASTTSFVPNAAQDVTATVDGTSQQWAFNSTSSAITFNGNRNANAVISAPSWNTGVKNATGVVAVLDSGIDYTHPDLADAMADMTPYVGKIGGTSHGYNAVDESAEPLDTMGHGTHVAGIIAASTNGFGVSGAANGVKLLPVKATNKNNVITSASIQLGYAYLKKAVQAGVDVRVVNNSWRALCVDPAVNQVVVDLGMLGVVSVFASGNDAKSVDGGQYTAAGLEYNQYSVVVDSLDANALASAFSNRGARCTDVFAPGGSILSTTRTSAPGSYNPLAMRNSSSTFETFSGSTGSVSASSDRGASVGVVDSSLGFDSEGGCLLVSGNSFTGLPKPSFTKATKRIWLNIRVDERKLNEASMVGCAVRFTGNVGTNVWLEAQVSNGSTFSSKAEGVFADAGNWTCVSLDLHKLCTDHNCGIKVLHSAGQAYIKVAVCIDAKTLNKNTASLAVDCVGVGSSSWHYGFMSGTSMAAPAVSGLAAVLASSIPNYTSLEVTARACKVANLINASSKKLAALNGLCYSGGVVNSSAFASAIANDTTAYLGHIVFEDSPDKAYTVMTLMGIGFGPSRGSLILPTAGEGTDQWEILSWTDSVIRVKIPLKKGSSTVTAAVKNASGSESNASTSSVLGGQDSSDPDEPEGPQNPEVPGAAGGSGASDGEAGQGASGGAQGTSSGTGVGPDAFSQEGNGGGGQAGGASARSFAETGDDAQAWIIVAVFGSGFAFGAVALCGAARQRARRSRS